MDVQDIVRVAARIMDCNKLSETMVGAIYSGEDGNRVEAGPKQVRALIDRGYLDEETETLSQTGRIVLHALKTGEVAAENEERVFPVATPSTSGDMYFITDAYDIRPFSEAPDGAQALSWGAAKAQVVADATARRKADALLIKSTRALRKADLTAEHVVQQSLPAMGDFEESVDELDSSALV